MNKLKTNLFAMLAVASLGLLTFACDNNDEIKVDPNSLFDVVLEVKEGGAANPNADVVVDANASSTKKAKVTFTATTVDMRRLYITQDIKGLGETIFKPTESVDLKADNAIDLTSKNSKNFEFQFALPVPAGVGTGTVVYKFWTTTGNGDFRDITQRLAVGPGTITMKFGTAANPDSKTAAVKSYTDVKLSAPLADGTSNTFASLLDGKTYNVNQGIEYVSLWDFGYLHSVTDAATLRAPYNYPTIAIDIPAKANTTNDELNRIYFKKSTKLVTDYDAVSTSGDLDFVTVDKLDANIIVKQLVATNVIEFVDQYGKKGMMKVLEVSGTNGSTGFIRIAIKVQP